MEKTILNYCKTLLLVGSLILFPACEEELSDPALEAENTLELTLPAMELELRESTFDSTLDIKWSTGTNQKTGASIAYTLEMDLEGGDFTDPIATFLTWTKNSFDFKIAQGDLNGILLDHGMEAGTAQALLFRVTARVSDDSVADQQAMGTISVTPFAPVSRELYMVGDATPNGWDIGGATPLKASTQERGVFVYEGKLGLGNFKFAVSQEGCWCQDFYTKDPGDPAKMVHNLGGSGEDLQWSITTALGVEENYKVTVDLLELEIEIEIVPAEAVDPPYDGLWIVGDATQSGWDIDSPAALVQSDKDPFLFSYEGLLSPGNFKIFAGPLGDWCGQWYRPMTDNQALIGGEVNQNAGCDGDTRWIVDTDTQGWYKIVVNTKNNTVQFNRVTLHLVGDGGPNGWNINDPSPMEYLGGGEYLYTGPLGADNPQGEFKISKYVGNWCDGDWINSATESQSILDPTYITTHGCDGPDNKWKLKDGEAGNYEIRIDLQAGTLSITKV